MDSASNTLLQTRLRHSISHCLPRLQEFLDHAHEGTVWPPLVPEEYEARAMAECLLKLGLEQDMKSLAKGWREIHDWAWTLGCEQTLASLAETKADKGQSWRDYLGSFPSQQELDSQERRERRVHILSVVGPTMIEHLRRLHELVAETPGRGALNASNMSQPPAKAGKSKRKRGRPRGSPAASKDVQLFRDWKAAHGETGITKSEFVRERSLPPTAIAAIERGRKITSRKSAPGRNSRQGGRQ